MSEEKIILPEDVAIKISTRPFFEFQDHTGKTFATADERSARYNGCTHVHCSTDGCTGIAQKGRRLCPICELQKERERIAKAPEWDGEYPVFAGDDTFLESDNDLLDYLEEESIDDLRMLKLWRAKPRMASDIDICYDDLLAEDCDLPQEVQEIVDEFQKKLAEIKTPLSYVADELLRLSDAQIAYYDERDESIRGE